MQLNLKNNNVLWGLGLIALGAFFLLQATGILGVLSSLFWSMLFAGAGAVFLYVFLTGLHSRWWAAIPGFTLLGLAATIFYDRFAPPFFSEIGGAVFLGSIGLGFLAIFFTNRELWWALIPGGALASVAGVAAVSSLDISFINPGSVLFIGLGLTFTLLGLLSTYLNTNLRWAYIPGAILLLLGFVVFTPFVGGLAWLWPLAFIAGGAYLVLRNSGPRLPAVAAPPAPSASAGNGTGTPTAVPAVKVETPQPEMVEIN